ncbi:bifunctional UDP-N-acetylglucosamine diphosphorylase/glucosamine-1-phosphate N-acetyltransferase GlmU [Oceaniserpentilla sp. 4NH20-0058]|uniref:bifunctional UDP-N-acetylglucosamine diphosphorylase/glucosamine-1-phosphate N-acetyltransferase GlmU n=1 Tax=Oceaniserpentilla sp. 4NH20-0058 TaxID=3127660 RepID=UPI00310C5667
MIDVVILAAGQGSRMKSDLPKVLHPIAGKPMLGHVIDAAAQVQADAMHVVVGHGADQVKTQFSQQAGIQFALQTEQKGTGHAVMMALDNLAPAGVTLILYGDVPLIQPNTLASLIDICKSGNVGLLTVNMDDPTGYGRIVRDANNKVKAIVEHKDANESELTIQECNTGILSVPTEKLHEWLPQLSNDNAQGEYYLTDVIAMSVNAGIDVQTIQPKYAEETFGVNNRAQQAELERWNQARLVSDLMAQGVTVLDPARLDIRLGNSTGVTVGRDVVIDVNVILEGDVIIGDGVTIEANCIIKNTSLAAGTKVKAFSHLEDALVKDGCDIGPYARLRPGAVLENGAKVGNFCEVKKSIIGEGSKVNHLTYIGDAIIGKNANIGAGTITCNYDGVNKFKTEIGDNAFVGSNSALVAPVKIGDGATVAAGSTITKEVEADKLAVARGKQVNLKWQRPAKK